jgi:hypothetical protein
MFPNKKKQESALPFLSSLPKMEEDKKGTLALAASFNVGKQADCGVVIGPSGAVYLSQSVQGSNDCSNLVRLSNNTDRNQNSPQALDTYQLRNVQIPLRAVADRFGRVYAVSADCCSVLCIGRNSTATETWKFSTCGGVTNVAYNQLSDLIYVSLRNTNGDAVEIHVKSLTGETVRVMSLVWPAAWRDKTLYSFVAHPHQGGLFGITLFGTLVRVIPDGSVSPYCSRVNREDISDYGLYMADRYFSSVEVCPNGNLYACNRTSNLIQCFDTSGRAKPEFDLKLGNRCHSVHVDQVQRGFYAMDSTGILYVFLCTDDKNKETTTPAMCNPQ